VASVVSERHLAGLRREKLALISIGVIVLMLLFCFVGPHLYVTPQAKLRRHERGSGPRPPERAASVGDRSQRLRHRGPAHGGRRHRARDPRLLAAGIATVFGVFFGAVSGYAGARWTRHDAYRRHGLSVPTLFLLIVIAAILHTRSG